MRFPGRAVLIGGALTIFGAFWGFYVYNVAMGDRWTDASLFRGPLFVLFCLVLANLVLRVLRPRLELSQRELIVIYTMVVIGAAMNGVGTTAFLVPAIASIYHYSDAFGFGPFLPYVPKHLVIHDPKVIQAFHSGGSTMWKAAVLRDWAQPMLWWSSFILALAFVVLCVQVLLRRQWVQNERLAFPLAYVPLALTEDSGRLLRGSRLFWIGFGLLTVMHMVNAFSFYYPAIPTFPLRGSSLEALKRSWPWSAMGGIHISFEPFIIGIAYLVNLDVSLSIWAFYLLYKIVELVYVMYGLGAPGSPAGFLSYFVMMDSQGIGAFIGVALVLAWSGRRRLRETARAAWSGWRRDADEMLSYRSAMLGAGLGGIFLLWFMAKMGLGLVLGVPVLLIMLIYCVVLSRVVSESGYAYFTPENGAGETVLLSAGIKNVPIGEQFALGFLSTVDQFHSDHPAPQQATAIKLGETSHVPPRYVLLAIGAGAVIGLAGAWWSQLTIYYHYGAASGSVREWWPRMGWQEFSFMKSYYDQATGPNLAMLKAMGIGIGVILLLVKVRAVFYWFPLHPAGYLICGTPAARHIWMPFMFGWLAKSVVVRYGGLRLYRSLIPFFLGVIVGDTVTPMLWAAYGALTGNSTYLSV